MLDVVLGIMLVCFNLLKKYLLQGNMFFLGNKSIKIIEPLCFGMKKSVVLIKVVSEYVLLSVSANEISYLKGENLQKHSLVRLYYALHR